jgi:predicted DNA-binding transcriptional regulator YafY
MQILQEETGEQHPLTIPQMIARLQGFGIRAERRCLRSDHENGELVFILADGHGNQPPQFEKTSLTKVIGDVTMEKKRELLQIKRYLEERTDEAHPSAIADILSYLESEGVPADRRTVSRDIERLMESGMDIICNAGRRNEYFCGGKGFELPELKLLVDAVQASRFISHKKSQALIGKLLSLGSAHQAHELNRHLYSDKQIKSENERVYITVDLLHTAINRKKQVRFKYYEYLPDKRKAYKHNGQIYEFSPYGLIWNGDHYYAAGYSRHHGRVITFRVDRIASPRLTDNRHT